MHIWHRIMIQRIMTPYLSCKFIHRNVYPQIYILVLMMMMMRMMMVMAIEMVMAMTRRCTYRCATFCRVFGCVHILGTSILASCLHRRKIDYFTFLHTAAHKYMHTLHIHLANLKLRANHHQRLPQYKQKLRSTNSYNWGIHAMEQFGFLGSHHFQRLQATSGECLECVHMDSVHKCWIYVFVQYTHTVNKI